jgi:vacuolar-type H+-ATPase subunit D/Vma8
MEYTEWVKD